MTVINDPPSYTNPFSGYTNVDVHINKVATVTVPPFTDTENDAKLTVTETTTGVPLSFTCSNSLITISPVNYNEVGTHTINVKISDG